MSKRQYFRGLRFFYYINGKRLIDRYKTIDDFLHMKFPKDNQLSPTLDTEISDITWNHYLISIRDEVKTVRDLLEILNRNDIQISNTDIRFIKSVQKHKGLLRKQIYSIEEIREKTKDVLFEKNNNLAQINLDGEFVRGNSQRYQTFFTKGCKCVSCGIKGKYFAKEKYPKDKRYHLNLYAIDAGGNEVLMTKDHIIPHSKDGANDISNYQTMCEPCNKLKADKLRKQ